MLFLVDGSNVAGAVARAPHDEDAKRELVRIAASVARAKRAKAILFFDGTSPSSFASRLGPVEVRFSGKGSADDAIVRESRARKEPLIVVTADRGLAARVGGREVEVLSPRAFIELAAAPESNEKIDWDAYFSDPNNRNI
jgi:hypothetical protein